MAVLSELKPILKVVVIFLVLCVFVWIFAPVLAFKVDHGDASRADEQEQEDQRGTEQHAIAHDHPFSLASILLNDVASQDRCHGDAK